VDWSLSTLSTIEGCLLTTSILHGRYFDAIAVLEHLSMVDLGGSMMNLVYIVHPS
jgi:hypothetical protein